MGGHGNPAGTPGGHSGGPREPRKPGKLLSKQGSGYSLGGGIGIKTPIGPLRLDVASQDLSGNMRYTLGVGWKF